MATQIIKSLFITLLLITFIKGRTSTFSRFMSHYIKNLKTSEILEKEQNMLFKFYIHYASFNLEERKKIISDTENFIFKIKNTNVIN